MLLDYCGYLRNHQMLDSEDQRLYREMEDYQMRFVARTDAYSSGWYTTPDGGRFSADLLSHWSRQFEYPFVARNVLPRLSSGDRVLDVGSGYGFFPFYLASKGVKLDCIDVLSLNAAYSSTNVAFRKHDITVSPLPDEYDLVYSVSVLEHVDAIESAVANLIESLKPRGILVLTLDVDLEQRGRSDAPDYHRLSLLLALVHQSMRPVSPLTLDRTDILTTDYFGGSSWRLPWRRPELPSSRMGRLRSFVSQAVAERSRPTLTVFLGVWEKTN